MLPASSLSPPLSVHLRRHAQLVRVLIVAGAALLLAQPVLLLFFDRGLELFGGSSFLGLPSLPIGSPARWRTAAASVLPVSGGLYSLLQLWRLFIEYGNGRVFGAVAQKAFMRFAWSVLLLALLLPVARGLMTVALSIGNPPGLRFLSITVEWFDCLHVLFGAVLVAIARVMVEAQRLADDNAGFV